jgi:adsorption protein B|tara:strand:- start:57941 stop:59356 length:1416 start_codon:yes stop_codon:yes gene_type:complete
MGVATTEQFGFWPYYWVLTRDLLMMAAVGVAVFGLDELFVDLTYIVGSLRRRFGAYRRYSRWTEDDVPRREPAGRFAIFVPAWDEGDVIGPMLTRLTRTLDHACYDVFVGVYANDPATIAAIRPINDERVHVTVNPRPGPTTKADCLNHIWQEMLRHEEKGGFRYKGVVLHDAEDVVHPSELRIFDHLMPRIAMVQLPVIPLPDADSRWVSGHYLDEFSEHHGKTLIVREMLGAAIPSAGVACAFGRQELGALAELRQQMPFDAESLTEDYEIGLRISRGGRGAFVRLPERNGRGAVATREHFPASFDAAVRQKTRWLTGIVFQGWQRLGWAGGLADRYMMLRDRKPPVNAVIILLAYAASIMAAISVVARWVDADAARLPTLVRGGSLLWYLMLFCTASVLWRLAMRAWFTARVYGLVEGALSIPRAVIANIFSILAARRALGVYLTLIVRGERLRWDKTVHKFPAAADD